MEILFASRNPGKLAEVRAVAKRFSGYKILGPEEVVHDARSGSSACPEVEETGVDYLENARLKAEAYWSWSGLSSLADDSGLEVQALEWGPGLRSARFAGPQATAEENNRKLLSILGSGSIRSARFRSVLFLRLDGGRSFTSEACLHGSIAYQPEGSGGFGYDSVFVPEGHDRTLAELKEQGVEIKTHRVLALERLFEELRQI